MQPQHDEDVLIARVHDLVPRGQWEARYDEISSREASLAGAGVVFIEVFLHTGRDQQRERRLARLDDPTKDRLDPVDVDERQHWDAYQQAFGVALARCSTDVAPRHLVPPDCTWYRDVALTHLLVEVLSSMDPQWPQPAGLDLAALRRRLTEEG